jgi:hypothetical protein
MELVKSALIAGILLEFADEQKRTLRRTIQKRASELRKINALVF